MDRISREAKNIVTTKVSPRFNVTLHSLHAAQKHFNSSVLSMEQQASHTGVRKYFFFIKEKVSSDWRDLAFHLGFEQADINNIAGRNRDDKSRCMDLLEEWLKCKGDGAYIEALMAALSEANLQSTLDALKQEYPELDSPQPSGSWQKRKRKEDSPFPAKKEACRQAELPLQDVFQKSVKEYYKLKLTTFKPLIWNDNFALDLHDIFTQLELILIRKQRFQLGAQRENLSSLDDLFNPDVTSRSTAPRCILIEGEAGGGKTTFLSKEALDAVSKKTELGRQHDIVLLIRLREARAGETIEEMVWDQCVPETTEGVDVQFIRAILQRNESRVLFLLDGCDELRPEARTTEQAIPKLLSGKIYPKSTIVITSRPSAGVQRYTQPDYHLHILGISTENVKKYIQQYFGSTGNPKLAKEFLRQHLKVQLQGSNMVVLTNNEYNFDSLIHTPFFLMLVCLLWEEDQEMVSFGSMTGLYDNLLTYLVRRHSKREGFDMPTGALPADVASSLQQLGKLALGSLLRNETLIDITELGKESVNWELLVKVGVVSLEVSASKLHPRKQLNFPHRTIQEFVAGRYIASAHMNEDMAELLQLTSINQVLEHSNLLQFICGCDSKAAQTVMGVLSKLSSKEFTNLRPELFEHVPLMPVCSNVQENHVIYRRFAKLCLNILNERKEPEVLQAFSQALPIIMMEGPVNSRESAALHYYIQNFKSVELPNRLIIGLYDNIREGVQYLQQCITTSLSGLSVNLTLRGEETTPDQTARLGTVLKNVPNLKLLKVYHLTPSSLQPLVQGFSHITLLEELSLYGNLGDAGMEVLKVGLFSVPHLAVLHLMGVYMTAKGMESLAPCMRYLGELRELNISINTIGDNGLEYLASVLPTFSAMQVLVLMSIGISSTGMHSLVTALQQLPGLVVLNISENLILDTGVELLAGVLPCLSAMKVLRVGQTGISDRGISALNKALPHLMKLQLLDVRWNDIGDSGIISLVQALCQPSMSDIEQKPAEEESLTTARHYNTSLQVLYMEGNYCVTGEGLEKVAQLICGLPALAYLDMYGIPISCTDTAAIALAESLARLPALEVLKLCRTSIESARGFQALVQAAEEHPTLAELRYSRESVPEGADTSASCLLLTEQ